MNKHSANALLAGLLLALASAGNAHAVDISRTLYTNPTGVCQGALPAFDGLIRKRPLAVQNEDTSPAFVTCSFTSQGRTTGFSQYVNAIGGAAVVISCTAVTGWATGTNQFVTKTVTAGPGPSQRELAWSPSDFGGTTTLPNFVSLSCNLPPGAALNDVWFRFLEDVGA